MNPVQSWWLRKRLRSSDEGTRRQAVAQLSDSTDPESIALLALALNDQSYEVAKAAINAIARFRTPAALDHLSTAVRQLLIERTLPETARKFTGSSRLDLLVLALREFGPAAAPVLISILQNRDAEYAAGDHAGSGAAAYAAELLGEMRFAPAASALMARLTDPSAGVRGKAAQALGELKYAGAVGSLTSMLSDPDDFVRVAAGRALTSLSWQPKDASQRAEVAVSIGDIRGAVEAGPAAVRPLLSKILGAYKATGKRGGPSSKPATQVMAEMKREQLPEYEWIQSLVKALEQIMAQSGASVDPRDLAELATLPDLRVRYMAEIIRENYHSGAEYVDRVPSDTYYDCASLRQRASDILNKRPR